MKLHNHRTYITGFPDRWRGYYSKEYKGERVWEDLNYQSIYLDLLELDLSTATIGDIQRVLGGTPELAPQFLCGACDRIVDEIVDISFPGSVFTRGVFPVCRDCLVKALALIDGEE